MDNLSDWLRKLITVLILAGFIEMLAPENGLKKTVKLVIGLMVMLILIQPLFSLFKVPVDLDRILSSSQDVWHQDERQVLERGMQMRERWQKSFAPQQRALNEAKLKSIIGLIDDVDLREVRFSDSASGSSQVSIRVVPAFKEEFSKALKANLTLKIQNSVQSACGFAKEQIEVIWDENS